MGGYVKGIVTGLASFVLGFAVLSVVIPVQTPEAPVVQGDPAPVTTDLVDSPAATREPAETAPDTAPAPVSAAPETPAPAPAEPAPAEPEPAAADPVSAPAETAPAPVETVPATAPAETTPDTEPSPGSVAPEAAPEPAILAPVEPEPAADPAPAPADPAPAPVETAPAAAPAEMTSGTEPSPGSVAPEAAPEPATPAPVEPEPAADPAPAPTETAPDTATAPDSAASEVPAPAPTEPEPAPAAPVTEVTDVAPEPAAAPVAEPVPAPAAEVAPDISPDAQPGGASAAPEAGQDETAQSVAPPEATAPAAPQDAAATPEPPAPAEPQAPLTPVPAPSTPATEPLLAQTPEDLPRVQAMPSGAPGVAVRRGGGETLGRLPTLGSEPEAPAPEPAPAAAEPDPDLPAIDRFAATPVLPEGIAPLGVVLTDLAEPGSAAETAILAFPVPVTVVLDPYDPDAPRRARIYRATGHEVALRAASLPALARPQDLAVTLDAWQRAFPGIVAFVDVPINGLGANAQLAREFAGMLQPEGYGVIALRDGLDAFLQAGRAAGLATAPVYRTLDDEDQSEITIRRLLDRAAFEALRQPGILVAGSAANPDTMAELADFARGQGRAGVALVPASAVLSRR